MINFGRVWAIALRYFYFFAKLDHLADLFYWPALDIVLWGITSEWIQQGQTATFPHIALAILTGLVFWQIVWRGNYEISVNLLQEFWNRNLVNLFSTPLKLSEWVIAVMIVGLLKILISLLFGAFLVYILYTLNVFSLGWAFLPFCFSLTISGWFIGFICASIMIYYGQRVQMLSWIVIGVFAPFSAVFYPVSALPEWAQTIAHALPMTYIFEAMRSVLNDGIFPWKLFNISLLLNAVYLGLSMLLFRFAFDKSREKGLSRLE
jgi:ABC-2 type transport system permease protein